MSEEQRQKTKEDDNMMNVAVTSDVSKRLLLNDLRESLLELNEKRKNGCINSTSQSSWRDLFDDDEDDE